MYGNDKSPQTFSLSVLSKWEWPKMHIHYTWRTEEEDVLDAMSQLWMQGGLQPVCSETLFAVCIVTLSLLSFSPCWMPFLPTSLAPFAYGFGHTWGAVPQEFLWQQSIKTLLPLRTGFGQMFSPQSSKVKLHSASELARITGFVPMVWHCMYACVCMWFTITNVSLHNGSF